MWFTQAFLPSQIFHGHILILWFRFIEDVNDSCKNQGFSNCLSTTHYLSILTVCQKLRPTVKLRFFIRDLKPFFALFFRCKEGDIAVPACYFIFSLKFSLLTGMHYLLAQVTGTELINLVTGIWYPLSQTLSVDSCKLLMLESSSADHVLCYWRLQWCIFSVQIYWNSAWAAFVVFRHLNYLYVFLITLFFWNVLSLYVM